MSIRLTAFVALCALVQNGLAQARTNFSRFGETGTKRSCSELEYRCRSGQCISSESLCDGLEDCRDGSDETKAVCDSPNSSPCSPRTFRCDYGACIDGDSVCNGAKDCADSSDEDPVRCGHSHHGSVGQSSCRDNQYRCNNGQCIANTELCDGRIDCTDRSDETVLSCGSFNCPQYVFRCGYGGCIDEDLKCNGVINCADGSDEDPKLCGNNQHRPTTITTTTTRRPSYPYITDVPKPTQRPSNLPTNPYQTNQPKPDTSRPSHSTQTRPTQTQTQRPHTSLPPLVNKVCYVPEQPRNGQYELAKHLCLNSYDCRLSPNVRTLEPGSQLVYKCNSGFRLNGTAEIFCGRDGRWSAIPTCEEIRCEPISTASRYAECDYDGDWVSCESPVLPKTRTKQLNCRNGYIWDTTDLSTNFNTKCNAQGEWEPKPIECVIVCGTPQSISGTPLIVNGTLPTVTEYPWHGTLYRAKKNEKQFICGATVIKNNLLITAAHCVYDETYKRAHPAKNFYVAVGNVFQAYDTQDLQTVQRARVKNIYISCKYYGIAGNYAGDIAILEIETVFQFGASVMPICLDTNPFGDQSTLEVGHYGKVPGFGRTDKGASSFVLQAITVPYVPADICKRSSVASKNTMYITGDKFCAGYTNGSAVCDGDSGGGLVFETDNHWYLRGIVSIGIGSSTLGAVRVCDSYAYSLYTRVAHHMEWIQGVIQNLEANKATDVCSRIE